MIGTALLSRGADHCRHVADKFLRLLPFLAPTGVLTGRDDHIGQGAYLQQRGVDAHGPSPGGRAFGAVVAEFDSTLLRPEAHGATAAQHRRLMSDHGWPANAVCESALAPTVLHSSQPRVRTRAEKVVDARGREGTYGPPKGRNTAMSCMRRSVSASKGVKASPPFFTGALLILDSQFQSPG